MNHFLQSLMSDKLPAELFVEPAIKVMRDMSVIISQDAPLDETLRAMEVIANLCVTAAPLMANIPNLEDLSQEVGSIGNFLDSHEGFTRKQVDTCHAALYQIENLIYFNRDLSESKTFDRDESTNNFGPILVVKETDFTFTSVLPDERQLERDIAVRFEAENLKVGELFSGFSSTKKYDWDNSDDDEDIIETHPGHSFRNFAKFSCPNGKNLVIGCFNRKGMPNESLLSKDFWRKNKLSEANLTIVSIDEKHNDVLLKELNEAVVKSHALEMSVANGIAEYTRGIYKDIMEADSLDISQISERHACSLELARVVIEFLLNVPISQCDILKVDEREVPFRLGKLLDYVRMLGLAVLTDEVMHKNSQGKPDNNRNPPPRTYRNQFDKSPNRGRPKRGARGRGRGSEF